MSKFEKNTKKYKKNQAINIYKSLQFLNHLSIIVNRLTGDNMYLKKIVASGFKSFATKITIDLDKGITGIVGPNGSGKSNVVDAIRWVLGEQSVKSLRGDGNMTDVIFSGSKSRQAMNVASVALVFDNTDHYLKLDYDEVVIKRRVYKDGTNEYSINNEKCRLKDINDLLLDSGMGRESFNIISQGKVEEIINSKPENRRVIFEEAARVLKYKKRKEEALRKLERTHDNMDRVNDIITELKMQIEPLKEQSQKAKEYKEAYNELEEIDIALITNDINNINANYQEKKQQLEKINQEIITLDASNSSSNAKIESFKKSLNDYDNKIDEIQKQLIATISKISNLNSRKDILIERKKYELEDTKLHNEIINLKEQELKINNDIVILKEEIKNLNDKSQELEQENEIVQNQLLKIKLSKNTLENKLTETIRNKNTLANTINHLKDNIENNNSLPTPVRNVLNNIKLNGIIEAIGSLIEVDEKYATAISITLGYASNYVVTKDEISAKEAIKYLINNKLGRVTFFPLNIIKSKYVDNNIINIVKEKKGYIDIASNLVKYDKKYQNIIENQLGNVIVVDNIDNANMISKAINYKYRIVTLNGEVLHVGGSITGGTENKSGNIIKDKYELEDSLKKYDQLELNIKDIENQINEIDYEYKNIEDKLYIKNRNKMELLETIRIKNDTLSNLENNLNKIKEDLISTNNVINNSVSKEEEEVLKQYYEAISEKEKLELELNNLKDKRSNLNIEISEYEDSVRKDNSLIYSKNKTLHDLEININRDDVKLDNLLNRLNETYNLTYEKAKETYRLEIDEVTARNKVSNLRRLIKDLGDVNVGAIEEYERVSERYEFLINQREDLSKAEDTLLEIIAEMDEVMAKEFSESFEIINKNFNETFKELFKGGNAVLKLTDPNNLLETGIEIIASPPGKKMNKLSLLSGGEKTFTAISLLFAILKSQVVPFCVLDEVEAALDEVNVGSFGEYISKLKEKTQFILITHKKKTMEYADTLYGITMQESGVSKLVSVKLEGLD